MTKASDNTVANDIQPVEEGNHYFELIKTMIVAVLIAVIIRTFAFEPFSIPSGSMMPSLLVGDYLFVSKYSYGYSKHSLPASLIDFKGRVFFNQPERGDVAVFKKPGNNNIDYIKRIIGLPGDKVRMVDGLLYINGKQVERKLIGAMTLKESFGNEYTYRRYVETLPNGVEHQIIEKSDSEGLDNTPTYTVPEDTLFVMGDNRDGSRDSRVMDQVGFVPMENLVGRAEVLFFSVKEGYQAWQFWQWPWSVRFERIFEPIG